MSIEFNPRPATAPVTTVQSTPVPAAAQAAVATTLPAAKAVTATGAGGQSASLPQSGTANVAQQAFIDRAAGELVYREVDLLTSVVVKQFPEEARLRARAYYRAQDTEKLETSPTIVNSKA